MPGSRLHALWRAVNDHRGAPGRSATTTRFLPLPSLNTPGLSASCRTSTSWISTGPCFGQTWKRCSHVNLYSRFGTTQGQEIPADRSR